MASDEIGLLLLLCRKLHQMKSAPLLLELVFIATTLLSVVIFYYATGKRRIVLIVCLSWMLLQALLASSGFYQNTSAFPPRVVVQVVPVFALLIALFSFSKTRIWIDQASQKYLTLLHVVRIPVEFCIYWLYAAQLMPELLTFEGRNFDLLAGVTSPLIYYFGYVRRLIGRTGLLIWNSACLLLLFNIVIHAALAVPSPFQQFGVEQPNVAILQFPFNWLPSVIVPLVMLAHFIVIRQLLRSKSA